MYLIGGILIEIIKKIIKEFLCLLLFPTSIVDVFQPIELIIKLLNSCRKKADGGGFLQNSNPYIKQSFFIKVS